MKPVVVNMLPFASSGEQRGGQTRTGCAEGDGVTLAERRVR